MGRSGSVRQICTLVIFRQLCTWGLNFFLILENHRLYQKLYIPYFIPQIWQCEYSFFDDYFWIGKPWIDKGQSHIWLQSNRLLPGQVNEMIEKASVQMQP